MTQEYQLKPFWHTQESIRMKQQEPWLHQFIFQQLTNIQNLAILLVLTIHELKIPTRATVEKTTCSY